MAWTSRGFTVAEAAQLAGLHRSALDVIIHRARHVSVLWSEKRATRRWFSPRDICVLRIAHELERSGRSWLMSIGTAFDNLEHPPTADTLLVAPAVIRRGCGLPRVIPERDANRLPFDVSTIVVPFGRICNDIIARCAELESSRVAV
ncbi:hypothetical protein EOB59_05440 [Mesorhizobium sp. M7A.F.Ca.MR.176.00.0.0]|uniref:hypothetical protein n=1 Tax=Mesorhizobium sp. M7A.F.Ca.MR.176.00.0.0 TaxID=2496776 RepID=UPI000FD33AA0|nr:hypothetical protein [Mesorhizobium sp. M7A.F.Ca.MR.176.00.0.0]RUU92802.1 hypothetical protein EOB59_05440 [Mesorhizobium sp. M7A.F.Ca.MR.176.00.0.0]